MNLGQEPNANDGNEGGGDEDGGAPARRPAAAPRPAASAPANRPAAAAKPVSGFDDMDDDIPF